MNKPRLQPEKGPSLEVLLQRHDLFKLIQDSHVRWINRTDDPGLQESHRAVIVLCDKLMQEYETLMQELR